jgi:hypothetical protein
MNDELILEFLDKYDELYQNATEEEKTILEEKAYPLLDFLDSKLIIQEEIKENVE